MWEQLLGASPMCGPLTLRVSPVWEAGSIEDIIFDDSATTPCATHTELASKLSGPHIRLSPNICAHTWDSLCDLYYIKSSELHIISMSFT